MLKIIIVFLSMVMVMPALARIDGFTYKTYESNGGAVRFPYTIQPEDFANNYMEAWNLGGVTFYEKQGWQLNIYGKQTYSEDTYQNAWNNKMQFELGLQIKKQINNYLSTYLNYSYNIQDQRIGLRLQYEKAEIGYNYYRDWWIGEDSKIPGFQVNKNTLKFWGNAQTPSTAYPGDQNITITNYGQITRNYGLFGTKYELAPFISLKLTVDRDQQDYNNSLQPKIGFMLVNPTKFGEMFMRFGYTAEYRWMSGTSYQGPMFEIGWYKAE